MLLSTLYVTSHSARVGVSRGSIEIRQDGHLSARIPMAELQAVVVAARSAVSMEAIGRCVDRGIRVAVLRRGGQLRFAVGGPTDGSVLLRVAQVRRSDEPLAALALARQVVRGKLLNQVRLMSRWADAAKRTESEIIRGNARTVRDRLDAVGTVTSGDVLRGLEGDAARRYFKAMSFHLRHHAPPPFEFVRRSRQPPRDPTNALLGYLYGLTLARAVGALDAVGLDPQIGFLHGARPGRPSLGLDLIEEHRPLMDRFAVRLMTRGELSGEDFVVTAGGAHYLSDDGRRRLLEKVEAYLSEDVVHPLLRQSIPRALLVNVQATLLARTIRGDIDTYPPLVMA